MSQKKCQICNERAKYHLKSNDKLYCYNCKHRKEDTKELIICELKCPQSWWTLNKYKFNTENNRIEATYFLEKDECDNCGMRNYYDIVYNGLQFYYENCDYCGNDAQYKLKLDRNIVCNKCNEIKYRKNETKLVICSTQCDVMPWELIEYLSKKNAYDIKLIYGIYDDICENCDNVGDSQGKFSGVKIKQLMPK